MYEFGDDAVRVSEPAKGVPIEALSDPKADSCLESKKIATAIFDCSIWAVSGHFCWYFGLVHGLVVQDDNDDTNTPARLTLAPR